MYRAFVSKLFNQRMPASFKDKLIHQKHETLHSAIEKAEYYLGKSAYLKNKSNTANVLKANSITELHDTKNNLKQLYDNIRTITLEQMERDTKNKEL